MGDKGGDHARNERCVMHDANADDLHGKDSRRQRCPEKGGKGSAHAAHDHNMLVFVIKTK